MNTITLSETGVIQKEQQRLTLLVENLLSRAKAAGATSAEVDTGINQGFSVSVRKGSVEQIEFNRDKSVDITVYIGKRSGSASTTDLSESALQSTVDAACHIAKFTDEDECGGLADIEDLAKVMPDLDLYHPWDITPQGAIDLALACESTALAFDKRITNSDGADVSTYQGLSVYGNSLGFMGASTSSRHGMSCMVIAEYKGDKERDYEYTVSRKASDLMSPILLGEAAGKHTVARLNPRKLKTQKAKVIFRADVAPSLLKSFIGAISGGNLYRKSTFLFDSMGQKIFPDHINLYETPFLKQALGSSSFDSDGVACSEKHFIKDGVVNSYVLSVYAARKLKMKPTGNGGGVHNLHITHSGETLPQLLKTMGTGFLVTELMGQGVSLTTGDYSQGAAGFWVKNGEIQYPVSGVTVAGNLKEMFANIISVAGDVDRRRNILTGSILLEEMMVAGS